MSLRQDADAGVNIPVVNVSKIKQSSIIIVSQGPGATVAGTPITNLEEYRSAHITATLTGSTSGTQDLYLQVSPDSGTTWIDYIHFAQLAAGAAAVNRNVTVSQYAQVTAIASVGTGTSPGLAANSVIGGNFTDRIRAVLVGGASSSSGASQSILLQFST